MMRYRRQSAVEMLRESGAKVVLSTFWRAHEGYIAYVFFRMGLPDVVVGQTPGAPTRETVRAGGGGGG